MEQKNQEYDLSAGKGIKLGQVADLIIQLNNGHGEKVFEDPEIAQPQQVELDISKIKALGYSPKVSIEEGIKRCFKWYKENLNEILKSRGQSSSL